MKVITTSFAASLLQSLYPVSIPVTASVYPYLHMHKKFALPNLPLCEVEMNASGTSVGGALHWWAKLEITNYIKNKPNKNAAILAFFEQHKIDFWDYDIDAGLKFCTRNVKKVGSMLLFSPNHVVAERPHKTPTLAQKLILANQQIRQYCASQGHPVCPMFASVVALRFNTKYTIFQIANSLGIHKTTVHFHLRNHTRLPFSIPSHVLSPPIETA
jgi:hypothetical protein